MTKKSHSRVHLFCQPTKVTSDANAQMDAAWNLWLRVLLFIFFLFICRPSSARIIWKSVKNARNYGGVTQTCTPTGRAIVAPAAATFARITRSPFSPRSNQVVVWGACVSTLSLYAIDSHIAASITLCAPRARLMTRKQCTRGFSQFGGRGFVIFDLIFPFTRTRGELIGRLDSLAQPSAD